MMNSFKTKLHIKMVLQEPIARTKLNCRYEMSRVIGYGFLFGAS